MNSPVWLYTWPAVSTLNMALDSSIPLVRKHMILILAFDTVRPNTAHTTTMIHLYNVHKQGGITVEGDLEQLNGDSVRFDSLSVR